VTLNGSSGDILKAVWLISREMPTLFDQGLVRVLRFSRLWQLKSLYERCFRLPLSAEDVGGRRLLDGGDKPNIGGFASGG
jgi:hypothetical protein